MSDTHLVNRPNLPKRLFWEFKYDAMDWLKEYAAVIERVIERGTELEWKELIRFYGRDEVVNTLKNETNYLPDEIIQDVSRYFHLNPTELKCYTRKQSLPRHFIYTTSTWIISTSASFPFTLSSTL